MMGYWSSTAAVSAAAAPAAGLPAPWRVLSEFGYFVALAAVLGGTSSYLLAVRPAVRPVPPVPKGRPDGGSDTDRMMIGNRAAVLLGWAGVVLLLGGYGQLAGRVAKADTTLSYYTALSPSRIWHFLRVPAKRGEWISSGDQFLIQNILFGLAAVLLITLLIPRLRRSINRTVAIAVPITILASVVNAIPSDFSTATADSTLDLTATQLHIFAGCGWLGGLATLALLGRTRRGLGEHAGLVWAQIWQRFSVVALVAVGIVMVSGCWLAWRHVGSVAQLLTTTYGRFLLVKLLLVAVLVGAGAYNQFVLAPRIAAAHRIGDHRRSFALTLRHFPAVVTVEAAIGAAVLLIVPFLSGSARKQAGDSGSASFDGGILLIGVVLVAGLAASLYLTYRVSTLLSGRPGRAAPSSA